jgi:hypothetical protein
MSEAPEAKDTVQTPNTPEEWQAAVDAAEGFLQLDSCRQYGLLAGGPEVNVERCVELLELGAAKGFRPVADAAERLVGELLGSSGCCAAPILRYHRGGRGRPSKNEGRPYCERCGKWCDEP